MEKPWALILLFTFLAVQAAFADTAADAVAEAAADTAANAVAEVMAQPMVQKNPRQDFFAASFGEAVGYGYNGAAFGGGLLIGAGTGGALGLRILYAQDNENISFLEVNVLARLYVFGRDAFSGLFVQLNTGPVIYMDYNPDRSGYGNISAGLSAGWRFLTGKRFFIEPALRIGYPYLAGGSLAIGISNR